MATGTPDADPSEEGRFARVAASIEAGSLLEATPECLVVTRADGEILYANRRAQELTGLRARTSSSGRHIELLIAADVLSLPPDASVEALCRRRGGEEFPVEVHVGAIDAGEPLLVVTLRDVSELQAGRDAQFEAEAKYRALVEHIPGRRLPRPRGREPDVDLREPADSRPDRHRARAVARPTPTRGARHVHPEDIDRAWEEYEEAYYKRTTLNHEYRMVHEDGTIRWVLEQAFPIDDEHGDPWLIQGVIFDITERKNAEEQVAFLAYHDKLTGLPNRALFEEMLDIAIARARRNDPASACCTWTWTTSSS